MIQHSKLSDILQNGNRDRLAQAWGNTTAAQDFAPLSKGDYVAHVISGELFTSRQNATPGYKLTFKVCEGPHVGRQFWHDVWLTPAALPMAKRDLGKLGVNSLEQLEQPLPKGIRCKVKLILQKDDAGTEFNKVRSFDVLDIDPPEANPFAPTDNPQSDGKPPSEPPVSAAAATPDDTQGDGFAGGEPDALPPKPDDKIPM